MQRGRGFSGQAIQVLVEDGPWSVQLPFAKGGKIAVTLRSSKARDAMVAAMQEYVTRR